MSGRGRAKLPRPGRKRAVRPRPREVPQHPAPRAPGRLSGACPGHLDICIARDIDGIITSGPGKARAIARSESFRYAIPIETRNGPAPARGRLWEEKIHKAHGGCLGTGSRRRARQAAIICGEGQTPIDPQVPEWGNPAGVMPRRPHPNQIGCEEATRGTETSKYPEERKSSETPRVAASESGRAQTRARVSGKALPPGGCGVGRLPSCTGRRGHKGRGKRNGMERPAEEGNSPVRESRASARANSRVGPDT